MRQLSSVAQSGYIQDHSPTQMMLQAEQYAWNKSQKGSSMTISLAIMAGAFIGLAFVFYITVTTGGDTSSWGLNRFAGGLAFSLGLILIVLCGGELFTSSMLSSIAWANKQISFNRLLKIWAKVYLGNFVGAIALLLLVYFAGLYQMDQGQWGLNALHIAQHKLHHTPVQAFALGVLCNLLVCLAVWLTFSSHNALTKAFMVMLPVAMFVSSGFEHSIANMFMVPLGISIAQFAPDSFWQQISVNALQFQDLTIKQFVIANLVPVTLGNIVGGSVLVALANWSIYRCPNTGTVKPLTKSTYPITITSVKDITMQNNHTVSDIMNTNSLVLMPQMPVYQAIDLLMEHNLDSAPVCNQQRQLVGFFSCHDLMVEMWCQDYIPEQKQTVAELMKNEVVAISAHDSVIDIIEYMAIDKHQLYPVSSSGIATTLTSASLELRAKKQQVTRPQVLPVLDEGKFVGVLGRAEVLPLLRDLYTADKTEPRNQLLETA
ncbi:formate transporter FocA [Vibrio sp.]|uniref:formate transporter FocA n=1 Tax=Vibrio sp. TaxID=678 RepID=UPI003D0EDE41